LAASAEPVVVVASAEFALKSSPVRRTLEQRLADDLRSTLTRSGFAGFSIEKHAARLVIRGIADAEAAARCCAKVFGVAYAAPATLLPASMSEVTEVITRVAEKNLGRGQSFSIRAHRSQPSPLSRRDVEVQGGSEVLSALQSRAVKVDLKHPDLTILVDLAGDRAYVYRDKLTGPGGLPLSSQWKMLGVLDSGPLSILAAYAMMRRGCLVELLIPISEKGTLFQKELQLRYAKILGERVARPNYKAFILDFDAQIPGRIDELAGPECRQLARSMAMRLAEEKKFRGLVFSDVVGQISADSRLRATTLPVFTPLIGMDKGDLLELCEMTGVAQDELLLQLESEEGTSQAVTTVTPEFSGFATAAVQEFLF
jgi:thiamine biosynthesis protein ThiI